MVKRRALLQRIESIEMLFLTGVTATRKSIKRSCRRRVKNPCDGGTNFILKKLYKDPKIRNTNYFLKKS